MIELGDRVLIGECSDRHLHGRTGTVVRIRKHALVHVDHPEGERAGCWGGYASSIKQRFLTKISSLKGECVAARLYVEKTRECCESCAKHQMIREIRQ